MNYLYYFVIPYYNYSMKIWGILYYNIPQISILIIKAPMLRVVCEGLGAEGEPPEQPESGAWVLV